VVGRWAAPEASALSMGFQIGKRSRNFGDPSGGRAPA
jgi:hypothetical protein